MAKIHTRRTTRRLRRRRSRQRGGAITVPIGGGKTLVFPDDLAVTLNDGAAVAGQMVTLDAAQPQPQVSWSQASAQTFYTLMCFDPDAPAASWLHWLVTDIEGNTPAAGRTRVPWAPPAPPPQTGIHRYFFCLFSHDAHVVVPAPKERGYFKPAEFIAAAGLKPVAAAFYRARATA